MPWVRIDDGFVRHPKVAAAGPLAIALQVAALCYCNQELTDGFIPRSVAATLLHWETPDPSDGGYNCIGVIHDRAALNGDWHAASILDWTFVAGLMVQSGLWHEVPGGFQIHDFTDYQPTKAQVIAQHEAKVAAGRAGGQASAQARASADGQASAQAESKQKSSPTPYPIPTPEEGDKSPSSSAKTQKPKSKAATAYTPEFDEFWRHTNRKGGKSDAQLAWDKLTDSQRQAACSAMPSWLEAYKRVGWSYDVSRWLNGHMWDSAVPEPRTPVPIPIKGNGRPAPSISDQIDEWAEELQRGRT